MARTDPRPLDDTSTHHPTWAQLQAAITNATNEEQVIPCIPAKGTSRDVDWTSDDPHDQALAARWCEPCPARSECKAWALATKQTHGVHGGLTPAQKKAEHRRQRHTQEAAA